MLKSITEQTCAILGYPTAAAAIAANSYKISIKTLNGNPTEENFRYYINNVLSKTNRDTRTRRGDTILHLALRYHPSNLSFIKKILFYGASINVINKKEYTPLNIALDHNASIEVVYELLCKGAVTSNRYPYCMYKIYSIKNRMYDSIQFYRWLYSTSVVGIATIVYMLW